MKIKILLFYFLYLSSLNLIFAQILPSVVIKDHNGYSGTVNIDCDYKFEDGKIKLTADYIDIKQPTDYKVESIPYKPLVDISDGNLVGIKNEDRFSDVINLSDDKTFNFCFYNQSFNSIIVSENGYISFNISDAGKVSSGRTSVSIPATSAPKNAIFGVFDDLTGETGTVKNIKVRKTGIAPYRTIIINYDKVEQFNSKHNKNSYQIVLYETTNIIDVYVKDRFKNAVGENTKEERKAVIGLQNIDGSKGITASNRNTGNWEAHNEAWRFTPDGSTSVTNIIWSGGPIEGSRYGSSIIANPNVNTFYEVKISYNICGKPLTISDKINIVFSPDFPTANEATEVFCINNGESKIVNNSELELIKPNINANPGIDISFYETENDAKLKQNEQNSFTLISDKTIYARVDKGGVCYKVVKAFLKLNKKPDIKGPVKVKQCAEGDKVNEDFNLQVDINPLITGLTYNMGVKYYSTYLDAQNQIPEIFIIKANIGVTTIYARIYNKTGFNDPNCSNIIAVEINIEPKIKLKTIIKEFCKSKDQSHQGDLTVGNEIITYPTPIPPGFTPVFEYFKDAGLKTAIINPGNADFIVGQSYYVKVSAAGYCYASIEIKTAAKDDCGGDGDGGGDFDFGGGNGWGVPAECYITIGVPFTKNLKLYYDQMISKITSPLPVFIGYYKSEDDAKNESNAISNTPNYNHTVTPTLVVGSEDIYIKYSVGGEKIIQKATIHYSMLQEIKPDKFDICDEYNDEKELVELEKDYRQIFLDKYGNNIKIYFYDDNAKLVAEQPNKDKKDNIKDKLLTKYDVPVPIYVLVVLPNSCEYVHELTFTLKNIDKSYNKTICDFYEDGEEIYNITNIIDDIKSSVGIITTSSVSYYYTKNDAHGKINPITDPTKVELKPGKLTIYIRLEQVDSSDPKNLICPTIVAVNFTLENSKDSPEINKDIYVCSTDGTFNHNIDLEIALKDKISILPNFEISYWTNEISAEKNDLGSGHKIPDTITNPLPPNINNFPLNQKDTDIFIRIYDNILGCHNVIPIKAHITVTVEIKNNKINVCDSKNDGEEEITISDYNSKLKFKDVLTGFDVNSDDFEFEYYETKSNAENGVNKITTPQVVKTGDILYVKVYSDPDNEDCAAIFEIVFELDESPKPKNNLPYELCNNDEGDGLTKVEVNLKDDYESQVIDNSILYIIDYYTTEADAINNNNKIPDYKKHIITAFPSTVYVRIVNAKDCFSISEINFVEKPPLEIKPAIIFEPCAIDDKGFAYIDLIVDLASSMVDDISIYNINFYKGDNNNITSIITTNISNYEVKKGDIVWVEFISNQGDNLGCYVRKKQIMEVKDAPKLSIVNENLCDGEIGKDDDGILNGKFIIDLKKYNEQLIENEDNISADFTITYHLTLDDAEKGINEITDSDNHEFSHSDFISNTYTIYIRVIRNESGCTKTTTLNFNTLDQVKKDKEETLIFGCDEPDDNGFAIFDLTDSEKDLSTEAGVTFTYYPTKDDAEKGVNPIVDPKNYPNKIAYDDIVYVRLNAAGHCASMAKINLEVYPYIDAIDYILPDICEFDPSIINVDDNDYILNLEELTEANMTANIKTINPKYPNLIDNIEISYYKNKTDAENLTNALTGTEITKHNPPVGSSTIYVRFQSKTTKCYQIREFKINKLKAPEQEKLGIIICDDNLDDIYDIILSTLDIKVMPTNTTDYTISYHNSKEDAWSNSGAIDKNNPFIININDFPKTIYTRVVDNDKCVNVKALIIQTIDKAIVKNVEIVVCDIDNDGFASFDISMKEKEMISDPTAIFEYYSTLNNLQNNINQITGSDIQNYINKSKDIDEIFVKVSTDGNCPALAKVILKTYYPENKLPDTHRVCRGLSIILDAGNGFDSYKWSTGATTQTIEVSEPGEYTVTVMFNTDSGPCERTFSTIVSIYEDSVIEKLVVNDQTGTITVIANGPMPLLYSIDNKNWQTSNVFSNLTPGIYEIYVKSQATNCEAIPKKTVLLDIKNVITPGIADGKNDIWKVCGLDVLDGSSNVKVFDRYGKMIFEQTTNECFIWNGFYLGRVVNSTTYWYVIKLYDGRKISGWILVKNRN